ncbi:SRPBCC family protein [Streptomyces sp. NBC_00400]|uniref:SRPBCC family protein n=1 Tax=Streptomyces sp. NBC_00400 TaxID=2975737 RepID=UPI002E1ACA62
MPETRASAVIPADATAVWRLVRDFNGLPAWQPGVTHSALRDGDAPDRVGSVRTLTLLRGEKVSESLVALDDHTRSLTYDIVESPYPVQSYRSTLRVIPLTSTGESVVDWTLTFDCAPAVAEELTGAFKDGVFAPGLRGLTSYFT